MGTSSGPQDPPGARTGKRSSERSGTGSRTGSRTGTGTGSRTGTGTGSDGEANRRTCASCGRTMTWRKAWADSWEQVRYCSDACRRRRITRVDRELESAILALLEQRARGATICPSEAARQVTDRQARDTPWQDLLEPARRAARRLVAAGRVEITQGGRVVDPSTARGPIRIRLSAMRGKPTAGDPRDGE